MPTFRSIQFIHPQHEGFARVVWFYLAGKGGNVAEQYVRVPFDWTDEQIEAECREWCDVHALDFPNAEMLTGNWEPVTLWDVSVQVKDGAVTDVPMLWFVVLAKSEKQAMDRAESKYRRKLHVYGPRTFSIRVGQID